MEYLNFVIFGLMLIFTGILVSFIYPGEQIYFFIFAGLCISFGLIKIFLNFKNKKVKK